MNEPKEEPPHSLPDGIPFLALSASVSSMICLLTAIAKNSREEKDRTVLIDLAEKISKHAMTYFAVFCNSSLQGQDSTEKKISGASQALFNLLDMIDDAPILAELIKFSPTLMREKIRAEILFCLDTLILYNFRNNANIEETSEIIEKRKTA